MKVKYPSEVGRRERVQRLHLSCLLWKEDLHCLVRVIVRPPIPMIYLSENVSVEWQLCGFPRLNYTLLLCCGKNSNRTA